jgi:hypothetical protein
MVNVPSQWQSIVQEAAAGTHLPESVVVAQINEESGFNPNAVSPAGAEGMFQFLPSTAAGYGGGNLFDPSQEVHDYINYMNALLKEEGGSVYKALEAYNAGPGNLPAGAGYATTILDNAGTGLNVVSGGGSGSVNNGSLTGVNWSAPFPGGSLDPLNLPFETGGILGNLGQGGIPGVSSIGGALGTGIESAIVGLGEKLFQSIGISSIKDFLIRAGLILIGSIIIVIGLTKFASISVSPDLSAVSQEKQNAEPAADETGDTQSPPDERATPRKRSSGAHSRQSSPHAKTGGGRTNSARRLETGAGSATKSLGKDAAGGAEILTA